MLRKKVFRFILKWARFCLSQVCDEISATENNIADLKKAIKDKENPMKVAQTRLHSREYRPNVELCRDPVQYKWVDYRV